MFQSSRRPNNVQKNSRFLSPELITAVRENDIQKLKDLRGLGVKFSNHHRNNGNSILHVAVRHANLEVFDYLLSLQDVLRVKCHVNKKGNTPLSECVGKEDFALKLLRLGCDAISASNLLLRIGETEKWLEVARLLLENGADANYCDKDGFTPLYNACSNGNQELIYMLLFYGADPTFSSVTDDAEVYPDLELNCTDRLLLSHPNLEDVVYCLLPYTDTLMLSSVVKALKSNVSAKMFSEIIDQISYIRSDWFSFGSLIKHFYHFTPDFLSIGTFEGLFLESLVTCDEFESLFALFSPSENKSDNDPVIIYSEFNSFKKRKNCPQRPDNPLPILKLFENEKLRSVIVDLVNECNMDVLTFFFNTKYYQLDFYTETFCFLASYGIPASSAVIERIFEEYGYCDLFKLMLHWELNDDLRVDFDDESDGSSTDSSDSNFHYEPKYRYEKIMPGFIYDVKKDVDYYLHEFDSYWLVNEKELSIIFDYFAWPELKCYLNNPGDWYDDLDESEWYQLYGYSCCEPTLVELTRNAARKYIINRFQVKNSMQFYTILKHLPIPQRSKEIISFERKLYRGATPLPTNTEQ